MGSTPSKPLLEWTSQELALALGSLGGAQSTYVGYAQNVLDNGVDGALLYDFSDQEFAETLTDLNITNRLHCRVLTKEWNQQKEQSSLSQQIPTTAASSSPLTTATATTSVPMAIEDDREHSMDHTSNNNNTTTALSAQAPMDTLPPDQSRPHPTSKRRSNVSFQLDSTTTKEWAAFRYNNDDSHRSNNEDHHHHNNSNITIHHYYGESYSGPPTTFQKRSSISDQLLRLHQSDTALYTGVQISDPDGHMSLSSIYKPKDPFFLKRSNKANHRRTRPQQAQQAQQQQQPPQIWTNHLLAAETEAQVRLREVLLQRNLVLASQIRNAKQRPS